MLSRLPVPVSEMKLLFRQVFYLHDYAYWRRNVPWKREKAALLCRQQVFHQRVYSRAVSDKSRRVFPHFISVYVCALLQIKKLVYRVAWSARWSRVAWAPAYIDIKQDSQLLYASFETRRDDVIRVTVSCPLYVLPVAWTHFFPSAYVAPASLAVHRVSRRSFWQEPVAWLVLVDSLCCSCQVSWQVCLRVKCASRVIC